MIRGCLIILLIGAIAAGYTFYALWTPYKGFGDETFVDIPSGTTTQQMADMLQRAGVIRSRWHFMLARTINANSKLQAGEYRFAQPATVTDVFSRIARGDIFSYVLSVPEGNNMFDIAAAIEQLGIIKASDFVKTASSPKLVKDLDPKAPSLEGYLFPATYRLTRHMTADQICKLMTDKFRKTWGDVGQGRTDTHEIVTLASLVEKETGKSKDRPLVASVYRNRLNKGMALDCDPTTIYASILDNRYKGVIHRSDLDSTNLYNTYKHPGLPPGPIASPGVESLKAAMTPAETDYLYFVAKPDGSGEHVFNTNLADHSAAVQAYRHGLQK